MAYRVGLSKETGTFGKHFLQIFIVNHHTHSVQVLILYFYMLPIGLSFESFSLYKYPSPIPC